MGNPRARGQCQGAATVAPDIYIYIYMYVCNTITLLYENIVIIITEIGGIPLKLYCLKSRIR